MTTCRSQLHHSMYVDAALDQAETALLEAHLHGCSTCAVEVARLQAETRLLRATLEMSEEPATSPPFEIPHRAAQRHHQWLWTAACVAGVAALVGSVWSTLVPDFPPALRWLRPFDVTNLFYLLAMLPRFLYSEDSFMFTSVIEFAGMLVFTALFAWVGLELLRKRRAIGASLLSLLLLASVLPESGHAVEIRRNDGIVTVAAGETIVDTVIAIGNTIAIEGNIDGDLLAFGRSITIRGHVSGNVITGSESVSIEGTIGGSVFGTGSRVELAQGATARNLYGLAGDVIVGDDSGVPGNMMAIGRTVSMRGSVGIDLVSLARELDVSGTIERNVRAMGEGVTLQPSARIGGDLTGRLNTPDDLRVLPNAIVSGVIDVQTPAVEVEGSRFANLSFYVWQVVRLCAAFLVGMLMFWVAPDLRFVTLAGGSALQSLGLGLLALIVLPFVSVIVCFTILGLPLGIAGMVLWLFVLYAAKIVVAQLMGVLFFQRRGESPHHAVTLLAGLVAVLVLVNLPYLGTLMNLALTLAGASLLVGPLVQKVRHKRNDLSY